jgi:hypothetical protein
MVGQFQTSDPLMKRELRLTFEDYVFYKSSFGLSETNLAYDRGVMMVYGIEKTATDLVALVVNGNGKEDAGSDKKFDNDANKNFGFRINQGIGDFLSVGGYYYIGKEAMGKHENEITYWGPDMNLGLGPIEITAQYLERKDTNPLFVTQAMEYNSKGYIAEIIFSPQLDKSRYYFTGLYNKIESDFQEENYETATFSATYLVARNLRLMAEFTRDIEYKTNRATVGIVSGF